MMQAPATTVILATWERAYGLGPVERGLALLSLAAPREPADRLAGFSIGRRDAALLDLRTHLFGPHLQSVVTCPQCAEKVELSFATDEIRAEPELLSDGHLDFELEGRSIRLRPASSADLLAVQTESSPARRRETLLRRCVAFGEDGHIDESAAGHSLLRGEAVQTIVERLAAADPQADIRIAADCPQCGHHWSSRFDIVSYLWAEIDAWAQRLLAEVHALALSYGWSEREILTMSAWRRQIYLEMLRR